MAIAALLGRDANLSVVVIPHLRSNIRSRRSHELPFRVRQGELKYGAARFICFCPQPTPVGIDDRPADRQPHPYSAGFRGVESLEDALEMARINTRPSIAHGHGTPFAWICSVLIDNSRGPS